MITEYNIDQQPSNSVKKLISSTKEGTTNWITLSGLIDYLENDDISLLNIHFFQKFFRYARGQRFSPGVSHTYISVCEEKNIVYLLAQDIRTRAMLLSCVHMDSRSLSWHKLPADQVSLNRLYNIIRLVDQHDSTEDYSDFLYSINDVCV